MTQDSGRARLDACLQAAASPNDAGSRRRATVGASIGNAVEWFDFAVYGFVAVYIGASFFPSDNPTAELLASFAVFGLTFFARPVGALYFGPLADRIGRKRVMVVVLTMMAVSTTLVGLLPTFDSVGLLAPILLILLRLAQGFSAGGEYGSVSSFLVEHSAPGRRGLGASWLMFSTLGGVLLGSGFTAALSAGVGSESMYAWGWRVPFLVAGPLGVIGLYVRLRLEDTPVFLAMMETSDVSRSPLRDTFSYRRELLTTIGLTALHSSAFYVVMTYMASYMTTVGGRSSTTALLATLAGGCIALPVVSYLGSLSDKIGRKPLLIIAGVLFAVLTVPLFILIRDGGTVGAVVGQLSLALCLGVLVSTTVVTMTEIFPPQVRAGGSAIGFNVSVAIFGGSAPFIATFLIDRTGYTLAPAGYLVFTSIIGLAAAVTLKDVSKAGSPSVVPATRRVGRV